ncbi:hypothetical protein Tco_0325098 [Tanacetum coccineum]
MRDDVRYKTKRMDKNSATRLGKRKTAVQERDGNLRQRSQIFHLREPGLRPEAEVEDERTRGTRPCAD